MDSRSELKLCTKCKESKSIETFRYRTDRKYRVSYCKDCERKYNNALYHKKALDPEFRNLNTSRSKQAYWENPRKAALKRRLYMYQGATVEVHAHLLDKQNGVCAICQETCKSGRELAIDHCHETRRVRGLLCMNCNQGLGKFKDSKKLLERAIEYLEKSRGN